MDSITGPLSGSAPVSQSVQPQKNVERDPEKLAEMNSKKDNVGQMEKQSKMSSKNAIAAEMDIDTQLKLSSKKATAAAKCDSEKQPKFRSKKAGATSAMEKQQKKATTTANNSKSQLVKQPKKTVSSPWTQPNPNFKFREPMLTEAALESAGPSCVTLHKYYMRLCAEKKEWYSCAFQALSLPAFFG